MNFVRNIEFMKCLYEVQLPWKENPAKWELSSEDI